MQTELRRSKPWRPNLTYDVMLHSPFFFLSHPNTCVSFSSAVPFFFSLLFWVVVRTVASQRQSPGPPTGGRFFFVNNPAQTLVCSFERLHLFGRFGVKIAVRQHQSFQEVWPNMWQEVSKFTFKPTRRCFLASSEVTLCCLLTYFLWLSNSVHCNQSAWFRPHTTVACWLTKSIPVWKL